MTLKNIVFSAVAFGVVAVASAAPFDRWFEHRITDGRTIRIHGVGDEYAARFTDEQGRNLVYNPQAGAYEYAEREDDETFRRRALERRLKAEEETGLARRWAELKARRRRGSGPHLMAPPSSPTVGTVVGVTLLVDFPVLDEHGVETNTLAACVHPGVTASDLNDLINGTNFRKYGNASSVREYFHDASSGHLDYTNVVTGWIKAPHPREYYDDGTKSCGDCGRALIGDVFDVLKADQSYATEYLPRIMQATTNADGEFLALNVFFAGDEANEWDKGLWAHKSSLSPDQYDKLIITIDGKSCHFNLYQISPVTADPSIGTFCHESGHLICGFPDLYDYAHVSGGVKTFCLMCKQFDKTPQNVCAYLRAAAGWVKPELLEATSGEKTVTVTANLQAVWKYSHPTDSKQYYLIENRQASGRDESLPASGIVIYRCDEAGSNTEGTRVPANSIFSDYGNAIYRISYEVSVEQADGLYEIERGLPADENDTWFSGNTATMYSGRFNATTTPCARWKDGLATRLNLSQFSANDSTMTFRYEYADARPLNDDLATASPVYGLSGTANGEILGATAQNGEPLPTCNPQATKTLWWVWTADYDGEMKFDATGSLRDDGAYLTTLMGIYTNRAAMAIGVASLLKAAEECVNSQQAPNSITFNAKAGVRYYICVSSIGNESGTVKLNWNFEKPLNDDFEDAAQVNELNGTVTGVNRNATVQSLDPLLKTYGVDAPRSSVWWKWTAPKDCRVTFDTNGSWCDSGEDHVAMKNFLGVYSSPDNSLENAVTVGEDYGYESYYARVEFVAQKGTTYYICVAGYRWQEEGSGHIVLQWDFTPANDNIQDATVISGRVGSATGVNGNATVLPGDPLVTYYDNQGITAVKTLWWKWTAPVTGEAVFDTIGSLGYVGNPMDTLLGIYMEDNGGLLPVAYNNDLDDVADSRSRVVIPAFEGQTYYICVASIDYGSYISSQEGEVRLNWNIVQGLSGRRGTTSYETMSEESLFQEYTPTAANSGWYSWNATGASDSISVTFSTSGSQLYGGGMMDTAISIYTNAASSIRELVKVAENDNINLRTTSSITFNAKVGVKYYICVESLDGSETGTVSLNWDRSSPSGESVDLASVIQFNTTIADGTTIYGTLGGNYKVSIAPGATVTLSNVVVNGENNAGCPWAGLTCEGDATLVLEGANSIRGFDGTYPGIYVPPGRRLDIRGSGSLTASSNATGAGIGGPSYMEGGDIYIHGGTITAMGGDGAAGIGSGNGGSCGVIVIDGGVVTATGGNHAAGIGSGFYGSCGDVTVGSGIDCVVATHGDVEMVVVCENAIGAGANASCGDVTVAQGLVEASIGATRMIARPWDGDLSALSASMAFATNGTVVTDTLGVNSKVCVAPGATVTPRDATINGVDGAGCPWAGITCLGDATIVLEGANAVMGFDRAYPGIYVPEGSTLVIRGPGSLAARSNSAGAGGAGIGGGREIPCGSIVIEGGTITADGSWGDNLPLGGAGIGGGLQSRCGDITILGGDATATGGGEAAGIGGGYSNKGCGAVKIGSHVTGVFAKHGPTISPSHLPAAPIGAGSLGSAVSVTLGPGLFDDPDGDWCRIRPWNGDLSVLDARNRNITAADGTTIYGTMSGSHSVSIAAGATVTLSNAVVVGATGAGSPWAGITCLGDATIVLEGDSSVRGFHEGGPGVQVPAGSTLAITGGGSLTARGNGVAGVAGSVAADDGLSDTVSGSTRTFRWNGDLSKLKGNAVATNGMTIRGALDGAYRVSIADGATVTLRDATIGGANSASCPWAGITCEGDATIVLEGANVVRGFYEDHPGICVPVLGTLTIRGTGSLAASSNGKAAGIGGGNGNGLHGGNIVIEGGMIVATGGVNSAGIGGGNGTDCGDISITGGDVTATGGANAAGIGAGGGGSSCHAIEVGPYIIRVVATCGEGCSPVDCVKAVTVTVHDSLGNELVGRTRTISIPVWDGNLAGLVRDVTAVNGTVITGALPDELDSYHKVSIAPGATVTLSNATIYTERTQNDGSYSWAGITCLGDATIILADASTNNIVRGFYKDYPGILVPAGSTLTIRGGGPLEVYSGGRAAGIGGGYGIPCGDIVIEGGDIEARGGEYAAAIGGGRDSGCGDITIGPGITRVVTVRSSVGGTTIGAGSGGTCGGIVLDGLRDDHGTNTRTLLPPWDGNLAGLTDKDVVTARDGMVLYGTNYEGKVSIAAGATVTLSNAACRANSAFPGSGWAGLACEGDATIVLVGDNDIQGFNSYAFGIEVPAGCTLSVQGAGSLNASGSSAGIGGGTVVVASGLSDTGDGATRTIRPWEWDGNLSALDRDVTAQDGMTLYGTLQGYHKVSVAAGATVTLSNAVISLPQRQDCEWAGVNCIGDARIVLADASTNTVKGFHIYYPGIHVPVGSTLAIAGRGVLNASSNGRGAGIGGGWNVSCGSIVIEGGTVNAVGGTYCAGIGGGYPNVPVDVTCGSITIGNGIAKVVATSSVNPIGAGLNSTCGTVTIHPDLIDDRGSPTRTLVSGGMSYDAWARRSGYGAWDAVNAKHGTYNVFLYAFGVTPYSPAFTLLDITFDEQGRAVVKTPPLKNNVGFTFTIGSSDNVDGTGNAASYPLDPSGETVIDETGRTRRFFRLRATQR